MKLEEIRNHYFIHSNEGEIKSFYASSDEQAEDIMACDKSLPKDVELDLNRFDPDKRQWHHVTTQMTMSATCNPEP
jgi:hypothetical protein